MDRIEAAVAERDQRLHFVGLAGSGMSALAQYRVLQGGRASGSDRCFDQGEQEPVRAGLGSLGIGITPQDGSGVAGAAGVISSTAVEREIPDLIRARKLGLPIWHRAELLAEHLRGASLAVAGTSGKSTVVAMVFEILREAGEDPGLITGARLRSLMGGHLLGNAWSGKGPLVAEADESDGSLVHHHPEASIILNLHRDHMETEQVMEQFRLFKRQTRGPVVVSDDPNLRPLWKGAALFGTSRHARYRATGLWSERDGCGFRLEDVRFRLPMPGLYNASNGLAATAICHSVGIDLATAREALARFGGVHRRFELIGQARGVEVVDDFAHNPVKLAAVLTLAKSRSQRVLALFQPHGFAPTRFQRHELLEMFAATLRPEDRLWIAPIFFAGGTVCRDISSADLVRELAGLGAPALPVPDRERWPGEVAALAERGDTVLVLGARDPSLPALAREVLETIRSGLP
ncbi:MAG: Mur ligase domain-containing protein [Planctomycetota bacterium]